VIQETAVPGWESDAPDGMIEFWVDGFLGVVASEGSQLSELQATGTAPVYQDIRTAVGDVIVWSVDHRGRATTEESRVQIGAPGAEATVQQMVTSPTRWATYRGSYTVPANQPTTRFMLRPIGRGSVGNLVDNVVLTLACGLDVETVGTAMTDTDGSGSDTSGDVATVTTSITNTGTATLLDLELSDSAALTKSCTSSTLMPAQTTTCTATYAVDQLAIDSGAVSGTALVTGHDAANVPISDSTAYSASLTASPSFAVALDATIDPAVVPPSARTDAGDTILLAGSVTNTRNVTLTNLAVSTGVAGHSVVRRRRSSPERPRRAPRGTLSPSLTSTADWSQSSDRSPRHQCRGATLQQRMMPV
jgi:hypothetical protein